MTTVSEVALKYRVKGAKQAQRKQQAIREELQRTATEAEKNSGVITRWLERNKTALVGISAAMLGVLGVIMNESPAVQAEMGRIRLAFSLLAMELGQSLQPAFATIGDVLLEAVTWFSGLPKPVKNFTAAVVALTPIVAGLALVISNASAILGVVAAVISGPVVLAIGLVVGALALLYTAWNSNFLGIRDVTANVVGWVWNKIESFLNWIGPYWKQFTSAVLKGQWGDAWTAVQNLVRDAIPKIAKFLLRLGVRIAAFSQKFTATLHTGFELAFDLAVAAAKRGANGIIGWVETAVNAVIGGINTMISKVESKANMLASTLNSAFPDRYNLPTLSFGRLGSVALDRLGTRSNSQIIEDARQRLADRFSQIDQQEQQRLQNIQSGGGDVSIQNNVTLEQGAVQVQGGTTSRANGERTGSAIAEGIGEQFATRR